MKRIKIKFLPYEVYRKKRVSQIFNELKDNTILLIDAKLSAQEEAKIIEETMKKVSSKFSGIEMSSLEMRDGKAGTNLDKIKNMLLETITGKKRGMTIIGPAKIVRKIEKDPDDLLLYM
jgi:hypothetical protein